LFGVWFLVSGFKFVGLRLNTYFARKDAKAQSFFNGNLFFGIQIEGVLEIIKILYELNSKIY